MSKSVEYQLKTGKLLAVLLLLLCCSIEAQAVEYSSCFKNASKRFNIDVDLLIAIGTWESRLNPNATHLNRDGTIDYGVMMINSSHLPLLEAAGFKKSDLLEPCTSIHLGAFTLDDCIKHEGQTWRAVGCYNTGPRKNRERARQEYVDKVRATYNRLKKKQQEPKLEIRA